jgi:3-oxoacyl-[acyl-carrier protein] reductase
MALGAAIVTGAGSGIGRATALRLARDGYALVCNDLSPDGAAAVAGEITSAGGRATAIAGDVSDEAAVALLIDGAHAAFGDVVLLVNNAGYAHQSRFVDLKTADFDRMFAVHVRGTFLCSRAVLPEMLARGAGVIVNIASQLGQIGGKDMAHYCGAKAAIIGMTKALAREVSRQGVRVNAVAPGPINTPLSRAISDEWRIAKTAELPLGRYGEAEEVASTIAFLASPESSLYVGQTLGPNSGDVML